MQQLKTMSHDDSAKIDLDLKGYPGIRRGQIIVTVKSGLY